MYWLLIQASSPFKLSPYFSTSHHEHRQSWLSASSSEKGDKNIKISIKLCWLRSSPRPLWGSPRLKSETCSLIRRAGSFGTPSLSRIRRSQPIRSFPLTSWTSFSRGSPNKYKANWSNCYSATTPGCNTYHSPSFRTEPQICSKWICWSLSKIRNKKDSSSDNFWRSAGRRGQSSRGIYLGLRSRKKNKRFSGLESINKSGSFPSITVETRKRGMIRTMQGRETIGSEQAVERRSEGGMGRKSKGLTWLESSGRSCCHWSPRKKRWIYRL